MRSIEGLRGAAIVTRGGRVRLEVASGLADAAAGVACTQQTRFQIASVSKQFAAAAAMLLAESGKIDLAEPVARWFPGCPPQWHRVTLHHLLTHTAGVRHWGDAPGFDASQPMDLAQRVALIQQAPLRTEPGTRWHYSSPGYLLAGDIVAQASGQPVTPWQLSEMAGTGDICSTVGDLGRFTAAVHSGSLVTQRSLPGYQSLSVWLPGQAACVVILGNDAAADTEALLRQLVPVAQEDQAGSMA